MADQHYNPANPEAHYRTTGPEIWEQTEGRVTHFVCSPGTGGTVSGVGRYLKEKNPKVRIVAGDPVGSIYTEYAKTHEKGEGFPYKVEGIGGDKIPTSLHFDVIDEWMFVTDAESFRMSRRLTREEGLFTGGSTGLNVHTAIEVARKVDDPDAHGGDDPLRLRRALPVEAVRRQLDAREPDAGGGAASPRPRSSTDRRGDVPAARLAWRPTANVRQALNLMGTYAISQIPVIDGKDCVGSLSEGPLMARALGDAKLLDGPVSEVMQAPFPVVDPDHARSTASPGCCRGRRRPRSCAATGRWWGSSRATTCCARSREFVSADHVARPRPSSCHVRAVTSP